MTKQSHSKIDFSKAPNDQRGVALLLTLGVLSLLLILGMSFAIMARNDRAAASVYSDLTKARLLADSGLERAMAALSYNHDGDETGDVYPATKSAGGLFTKAAGQRVFFSQSSTPGINVNDALNFNLGFDYFGDYKFWPEGARWQHIMEDTDDDGSDEIIGRLAFIVVDESGKIDPAAVVNFHEPYIDLNSDGDHDTGEPFYDWNDDGNYDDIALSETSEQRWGYSPTEIDLAAAYPLDGSVTDMDVDPDNFRTSLPTWSSNAQPRWFSWQQMAQSIPDMNPAEAQALAPSLFPFSYDQEMYWQSSGSNATRFNLVHTNWGTTDVTSVTSGIPWVNSMIDDDGNSLSNQVAANIIDYSDSNSYATSNYPGDPSDNYCGVEEAAYINEVEFILECAPADPTGANTDRLLEVKIAPEMINIYEANFPTGAELEITVEFTGLGSAAVDATGDAEAGADTSQATFIWSVGDVGGRSYKELAEKNGLIYRWSSGDDPANFKISQVSMTVYDDDTAIASTLFDWAQSGESDTTGLTIDEGTPGDLTNDPHVAQFYSISAEAKDPRSNTLARNWEWTDWSGPATSMATGAGSLDGANAAWDPGGDDDLEVGAVQADPVGGNGISTAYVRNAGMKSLWELGAIHRGEPWRTVNLKSYDDGTNNDYANGDAAILNQVKLGPATTAAGRLNINSPVPEAWRAMLYKVRVGSNGYDDPENGGPQLGPGQLGDATSGLIGDIMAANGSEGGSAKLSRGELLGSVTSLSDGSASGVTQNNDRAQEEIIGKIANLLTARQNYFRIVVTAQSVRDLGTPPAGVQNQDRVINYNGNKWCRVLAEQKIMAIVYRDAFSNNFQIERVEYLED